MPAKIGMRYFLLSRTFSLLLINHAAGQSFQYERLPGALAMNSPTATSQVPGAVQAHSAEDETAAETNQ
jgi:hypothetical protein